MPSRRGGPCAPGAGVGRNEHCSKRPRRPSPLPDIAFQDADEKPLRFAEFRGQALLINFWATWCAPCVKEMPSLDRLQAMFPQDKFLVLPLSIDGPTQAQGRAVLQGQEARQSRHLLRPGPQGDAGAWRDLAADLDPGRSARPGARPLEGDADWDMPEGVASSRPPSPARADCQSELTEDVRRPSCRLRSACSFPCRRAARPARPSMPSTPRPDRHGRRS